MCKRNGCGLQTAAKRNHCNRSHIQADDGQQSCTRVNTRRPQSQAIAMHVPHTQNRTLDTSQAEAPASCCDSGIAAWSLVPSGFDGYTKSPASFSNAGTRHVPRLRPGTKSRITVFTDAPASSCESEAVAWSQVPPGLDWVICIMFKCWRTACS